MPAPPRLLHLWLRYEPGGMSYLFLSARARFLKADMGVVEPACIEAHQYDGALLTVGASPALAEGTLELAGVTEEVATVQT